MGFKKRLAETFGDRRTAAVDFVYNVAGSVLYAAGLMLFARAAGFAIGGLSGVSLLINHFTGFPVGTATLLLDIPLVFFSWRVLGRHFMLKSGVCILIMTLVNDVLFARLPGYEGSTILAALYCGALMGAGLGMIYSRGYSTGGTDFLVMPLHRMVPRFTLPQIAMAVDAVIILAGGLIYRNVDSMLYGIVVSVVCTAVMDRVMNGAYSEKLALIITSDGLEMARHISDAIGRGATNVDAVGTFTGARKHLLLCACSRQQVVTLRRVVRECDPRALLMITEITEAFGEGFQSPDKQSL